jgi:hypothetical protein
MTEPAGPRKKRRRLLWALGAVLALGVALVLALTILIDAESFRPEIERVLRESTGWEAELGDVELSLFRGALGVSPASLTAPGGDTSKIEVDRIDVKVELLALLRKQLKIERIHLVRPEILLVRPDEATGWVVPVASARRAHAGTPAGVPQGTENDGPAGRAIEDRPGRGEPSGSAAFEVIVDEIGVRDGKLRLEDRAMTPAIALELNDVTSSFFPADGGINGRLSFGADEGRARWRGQIGKTIEVTLEDLETTLLQTFLGRDLIHPGGRLSGELALGFPLRIEGDLSAANLTLLSGERPFDESGLAFVIAPLGLGWQLERLEFRGDGARLVGNGPLSPRLELRLELPETPLDAALRASESVLPLPLEILAPGNVQAAILVARPEGGDLTYEASGSLAATELRPGDLLPAAKDVRATFTLNRAGRLEVQIAKGTVAGGPVSGTATIDSIYPAGTLSFSGGLRDAVFGQLLGGLVHEARPVTGSTGFNASLGVDLERAALDARSLSGSVDFNASSLSMPGWDLDRAVRGKLEDSAGTGAGGLLKGLLGKDTVKNEASGEEAVDHIERLIDSLEGKINFDRWPWGLEGVRLAVGDVSSSGDGWFDPEAGTVEFTLTSKLTREESSVLLDKHGALKVLADRSGRLTLPVTITGSLVAPSIKVDVDKALKGNLLGEGDKKDEVKGLLRGLLDRKKKD